MAALPVAASIGATTLANTKAPSLSPEGTPEEIRRKAEEFESFFMTQMVEHMFKGVSTDSYFGGGYAEDTYRSMMVQEFGKALAKAGGLGIADAVSRELMLLQEMS
jgi:Rod binding domain-containing protein